MGWVMACRVNDVEVGTIKRQRLPNGVMIGLTRLPDNRVVAFENKCPHVGGPLALGKLKDTEIVCPWHFFRFDLLTGETLATDKSIMRMKVFQVKVEQEDVYVDAN
jgi:nitrite reductase (NADH) small subunit